MKRIYLIALVLFLPFRSFSQILNVEKDRIDTDTANVWLGNFGVTLSSRQQQTNVLTFNAVTNVVYLSSKHTYALIGSANLIKVSGADVISDGYLHARINFNRNQTLSSELFAQGQYDESRGLRGRGLGGGGLRYRIRSSDKLLLQSGVGVMYEYEQWSFEENSAYTSYIKSTNYVSAHWKISERVNTNVISYYQARYDAFFHPRISGDANLQVSINKRLALSSRFVITYDAIPVIPVDKLIYTFTNGLTFKF